MDWQQIMDEVLEVTELQQIILAKSESPLIKEIINREKKYLSQPVINLRALNNAVLENQVRLVRYQLALLERVSKLSVLKDPQKIYINMPQSQLEAEKYVIELKKKYLLAIDCLDLVINIEKIAKTEYEFGYPIETSVYSRMSELENEIFSRYMMDEINQNQLAELVKSRKIEFIKSLSIEEKKQLFIEFLVLSYDRNAFDYFNRQRVVSANKAKLNLKGIECKTTHTFYKAIIANIEISMILNMPLQEVCDSLKVIYETNFFKQKLEKKYV